jgi:2-C-methyl-D-erythritol 4-phosphate cytidylyltransferase
MDKKCYAIIVAGGTGSRFGGEKPKQFLPLDEKPVLWHAAEPFTRLSFPVEILIVIPASYVDYWKEICEKEGFEHKIVAGGITRFHSVKNALKFVGKEGIVAVHDGVRPVVTCEFLEYLFNTALEKGAVIPVIRPVDSLRIVEDDGSTPADRNGFVLVQTPQVFQSEILQEAYMQAYSPEFTDDASVVQRSGKEIFLAEGLRKNIKITKQEDLDIARALINAF